MVLRLTHHTFAAMYSRKPSTHDSDSNPISSPLRALELAYEEVESRKAEMYRRGMLPDHPTFVEHGPVRILISSSPSEHNLADYASLLRSYNVSHVVRACEPTYSADNLAALGFQVHEMPFADGEAPSRNVISDWLSLLDKVCGLANHSRNTAVSPFANQLASHIEATSSCDSDSEKPKATVAVHCARGLGRAPILAAIALVEAGLDPFEAVGSIRASRRGAMNGRQMAFVESYARRPPPSQVKHRQRSRSGSFVGSFWPSLKAARPFRPRSPSHNNSCTSRQHVPPNPMKTSDI
ncbi:tyrosine phosphatase type IVA A [Gracilariopsis chorda]|uniref:Tyrosine phosphatase type IVA A n=1 Tax=Gracilariopsis chorda TaxID=448386 RepID=A0A2V3J0G8_9FLOR|nr:tyrosine phosphatase type IVA A [Gracilariopsis chorda]|eukprot:PXF47891.1 tyrosine phosphatase type IVA A [Gracilariopsis chorda]